MFEATKNKASLTERPILMDSGFIIPSRRSSMFLDIPHNEYAALYAWADTAWNIRTEVKQVWTK